MQWIAIMVIDDGYRIEYMGSRFVSGNTKEEAIEEARRLSPGVFEPHHVADLYGPLSGPTSHALCDHPWEDSNQTFSR